MIFLQLIYFISLIYIFLGIKIENLSIVATQNGKPLQTYFGDLSKVQELKNSKTGIIIFLQIKIFYSFIYQHYGTIMLIIIIIIIRIIIIIIMIIIIIIIIDAI
jgi:hypothetical protein